jgi:hypothetical protein
VDDEGTSKSLTDVLVCLRELLRRIDAGEITADDRQRDSLQAALAAAECMAAARAGTNGHG